MNESTSNWLSRFAVLAALSTLGLIFLGGMVTSKDAGLSVPDWPLSYGSLNPPGWWHVEPVRLEHGHRIIGAVVGVLTTILLIWTWRADRRRWVRALAVAAFIGVCVQGLMGGLRVTQMSLELAVVHGVLGQMFFSLLVVIAVVTSRNWAARPSPVAGTQLGPVRTAGVALVIALFLQLVMGAVMRHYKAGMAIPDFPLAFGMLIPPLTNFEVSIHFAHRVGAVVVASAAMWLAMSVFIHARNELRLLRPVVLMMLLVVGQIVLGAYVIWLAKAPVPTTFHVMNGAAILGITVMMLTRLFAFQREAATESNVPARYGAERLRGAG